MTKSLTRVSWFIDIETGKKINLNFHSQDITFWINYQKMCNVVVLLTMIADWAGPFLFDSSFDSCQQWGQTTTNMSIKLDNFKKIICRIGRVKWIIKWNGFPCNNLIRYLVRKQYRTKTLHIPANVTRNSPGSAILKHSRYSYVATGSKLEVVDPQRQRRT